MISGFKYQEAIASGGVKHLRNMRTHSTIDIELDGVKILRICIKIDKVAKYCRRATNAMYGNYIRQIDR